MSHTSYLPSLAEVEGREGGNRNITLLMNQRQIFVTREAGEAIKLMEEN